jgi:hypothetical protein
MQTTSFGVAIEIKSYVHDYSPCFLVKCVGTFWHFIVLI